MDDAIEQWRRWVEEYGLSDLIVSVLTPRCRVVLHRQRNTGAIYCINIASQSTGLGFVSEGVGWTTYENERYIYGCVPLMATSFEVMSEGQILQAPTLKHGAFLAIVELPSAVVLAFKDAAGQDVKIYHLPIWQPTPIPKLARVRHSLRYERHAIRLLLKRTDNGEN
jgi:hypothetical protein